MRRQKRSPDYTDTRDFTGKGFEESSPLVRRSLLAWWKSHGRSFPWRDTRDPYRVLIAELMLLRTRAEQVVPVYLDFIARFPTFTHLEKANLGTIERVLSPLGLRWRVRSIISLVPELRRRFGGTIPLTFDELTSLPGVSDYVAGAVCCFADHQPKVLLDTNIVRVVARLTGSNATDSSRRSLVFRNLVRQLRPEVGAREFYFALLDLAASVCLPRNPSCVDCPILETCHFGSVVMGNERGIRHGSREGGSGS